MLPLGAAPVLHSVVRVVTSIRVGLAMTTKSFAAREGLLDLTKKLQTSDVVNKKKQTRKCPALLV